MRRSKDTVDARLAKHLTGDWLAAGRFDDLADLLARICRSSRSPANCFAYGRALALAGRVNEAETWLRRADRGGHWILLWMGPRWRRACRLMRKCLGGEIPNASKPMAGVRRPDWLAVATILADRGALDAALQILELRIGAAWLPASMLVRIAQWATTSPQAGETLVRLATAFPFKGDQAPLLALLRQLLQNGASATLEKLLDLAPRLVALP